ncbi:MAG: ATP-dependent DNA ligase [Phycisphaerales bacterium]|nr:ATP-dependent DNA ligase [Phycisphaerales bacterium]
MPACCRRPTRERWKSRTSRRPTGRTAGRTARRRPGEVERFTRLYLAIDATTRTSEKVSHLRDYFASAAPADAAWAVFFLTGHRLRRVIPPKTLRAWVAEASGYPPWLITACRERVGDLAETMSLLLPAAETHDPLPLHRAVEERIAPLRRCDEETQRALVTATWAALPDDMRFVWNKLLLGSFRFGVGRRLVTRALAKVADIEPAIVAHRLMGGLTPTPEAYTQLVASEADVVEAGLRPYPFCLAHGLDDPPSETCGSRVDWQVEWKWDGIRAQLLRRGDDVVVWSRGEEIVNEQFPEIAAAGADLPPGTTLDGEILAWSDDRPLPFAALQRRLGRRMTQLALWTEVPVAFIAFDLLEQSGGDARERPLRERRAALETLLDGFDALSPLRPAPIVPAATWAEVAAARAEARTRGAEGLMIKRLDAAYGVGRERGVWWKWKVDPHHVDAVLIAAERGHGRRAGLFTDYTFGLWDGEVLVPVAKAYSGLTNEEIRAVDRHVRATTRERHGPVHVVTPELVFEIAFERVQASTRHRSGVAVRFPRMTRWRTDKKPEEADTLPTLKRLIDDGDAA